MSKTVIVSDPSSGEFVSLANTGVKRVFRKQILPMNGSFVHPNDPSQKITIDTKFAQALVQNFRDGICDTVQFPLVDEKNRHVEDPTRNLGQVVDLSYDDKGVWATIEVRKTPEDIGTTILGASAMMNLNYSDTATGRKVGPTLLHVAATNRPYLTKLAPYEEIALSNANADTEEELVLLTPDNLSETEMNLPEMLKVLKDTHNIDVEALQATAAAAEAAANPAEEIVAALSGVIKAANSDDFVALSADNEKPSLSEVADGVVALTRSVISLREENVELSAKVKAADEAQAETDVDAAIREGKILPKQREAFIELRLSNSEMYERLVPDTAVVSLSEDGVTSHEQTPNEPLEEANAEVARLAEVVKNLG
jgi:hypothetical protein